MIVYLALQHFGAGGRAGIRGFRKSGSQRSGRKCCIGRNRLGDRARAELGSTRGGISLSREVLEQPCGKSGSEALRILAVGDI